MVLEDGPNLTLDFCINFTFKIYNEGTIFTIKSDDFIYLQLEFDFYNQ